MTGPDEVNPFQAVVRGEAGDRWADLSEAWEDLLAVLSDETYTMAEIIASTGIPRRTVKGLLFHGRKAGRVWRGTTSRREEVAPGLWTVFTVQGFRAVVDDEPVQRPPRTRPWTRASHDG